jgi:BMFP domain-containing protein YqiC
MAQAREKFMEMQKRIEKLEAEVKQMKESLKPNAEVKEPAEAK